MYFINNNLISDGERNGNSNFFEILRECEREGMRSHQHQKCGNVVQLSFASFLKLFNLK